MLPKHPLFIDEIDIFSWELKSPERLEFEQRLRELAKRKNYWIWKVQHPKYGMTFHVRTKDGKKVVKHLTILELKDFLYRRGKFSDWKGK